MPLYKVRVLDEVGGDLDDLADFYEQASGIESAIRFEGAFQEALATLAHTPKVNPKWRGDENVRRLNMHSHKVAIIYTVNDHELQVIAVQAFHSLSDPDSYQRVLDKRLDN